MNIFTAFYITAVYTRRNKNYKKMYETMEVRTIFKLLFILKIK